MTTAQIPSGFRLKQTLRGHTARITCIAWSANGRQLASSSEDKTVRIWDPETQAPVRVLEGHGLAVDSLAWSPDGSRIASGSMDKTIRLWDVSTRAAHPALRGHVDTVTGLAWSPDGRTLASGSDDGTVRLWEALAALGAGSALRRRPCVLRGHGSHVRSVAWSPDGRRLASGSADRTILVWDVPAALDKDTASNAPALRLEMHTDTVSSVAWSPDGRLLASASLDSTIRLWDGVTGRPVRILEGHTKAVHSLSFSADGRFLGSVCSDGVIRLWRCATWETVAQLCEWPELYSLRGLAFSPSSPILATFGPELLVILIWEVDPVLLLRAPAVATIRHTSAKVVLVGESNVGKSCLALRLVEDRYQEQSTTHGMRFWHLPPERLSPLAAAPVGERREVTLWDMGGQDEYRLVHQLFLHDTSVALVVLDPTRGRTAFEEVAGWNLRLEKQLRGRKAVKLLVGSKMDDPNALVDQTALKRLVQDCGFGGYHETSAKTNRGLRQLGEALAAALDWGNLTQTSRPVLFQRIRDVIERQRANGVVTILFADLVRQMHEETEEQYEPQALDTVVAQLAAQGVLADTRISSGERALILQVGEVERYAGALILLARDNPRGIPALEEHQVVSPQLAFPGINKDARLPRREELMVLECVVQLLLEHGICLRHEGLLVFPALFRPTEGHVDALLPHAVSLYYDFSGAIDNIYSSLVVALAYSSEFGRVRLWEDRAQFDPVGAGACGLRKVERKSGFARLDVYFEPHTLTGTRDLFLSFVDERLRQQGVDIRERLEITCICGFVFDEETARLRIAEGKVDVGCPRCERRIHIAEGAQAARQRDSELERKTWALRTEVEKRTQAAIKEAKRVFMQPLPAGATRRLRLLHLSDLHFAAQTDPQAVLQPLIADLRDKEGGLACETLDYLVISGDLATGGKAEEFEQARNFISGVIERFGLTAARCLIVPGNHDLDWDEAVYEWQPRRRVDVTRLAPGTCSEQGDGYLIRTSAYPNRFRSFSEHFYHPLVQQPYPLRFEDQGLAFLFPEAGVQFLAFNSTWETDEHFPDRSGIHSGALARALMEAEEQVGRARKEGTLPMDKPILRIALWHHPVQGPEQIRDDGFMERLKKAGVRLCLHGHVHQDRADLVGYLHPTRSVHVAGAGSFGAPVRDRPESVPRLYNVVEIAPDLRGMRVHTRCLRRETGAWEGWAVWPGATATECRTYYDISLRLPPATPESWTAEGAPNG